MGKSVCTPEQYYQAIQLHKQGFGRHRISRIMNLPKSMVSHWLHEGTKPFSVQPDYRKKYRYQPPENYREMTPQLAYLIGALLGDGTISKEGRCFHLTVCDLDFIHYFKKRLEEWSGKKTTIHKYKRKRGERDQYRVGISSLEINDFLMPFKEKMEVPKEIMEGTEEEQAAFLKGFIDSEGNFHKGRLRIANTKTKLLCGCVVLFKKLGFKMNSITLTKETNAWQIVMSHMVNFKKFKDKIGFTIRRKERLLDKYMANYGGTRLHSYEEYSKAVQLLEKVRMKDVEKKLGINRKTLYRWKKGVMPSTMMWEISS